ncbi:glycosyl transferase family 2 [Pacificibacter maritimus]|uniref:Glycosyl transferase family 2 n=1 Tax=Pacificibacter maritimus TaxID=762213 RepID=A0A3N4UVC0_9RHOB|nr:glycosyltransferase [Pacificibacter maritimus]RPE64654.1 glycosyl transferase family 2 [Pacificibacter maritimus]
MTQDTAKILILLATYNGDAFLQEQLDSLIAQTDKNWDLLVSDDGSSDTTVEILQRFKQAHSTDHDITILTGPQSGCAQNFLFLIRSIPENTRLISFSDQDDVWFPDKLARARKALNEAKQPSTPLLYAADVLICDHKLAPLHTFQKRTWTPSVGNSFVQSIGAGNTMMLNAPAIRLLQTAANEVDDVVVHDWWAYQVISCCGGTVLRDPNAVLRYRQHDNNVIGSNISRWGQLQRVRFVSDRRFAKWNDINIKALNASRKHFTAEAKRALSYYSAARFGPLPKRLVALFRSGAARQRRRGNFALYLACITKRL